MTQLRKFLWYQSLSIVFFNSVLSVPGCFSQCRFFQYSGFVPVQLLSCPIPISSLKQNYLSFILEGRPYQTAILNFPIASRKYSRWAVCLKSPSKRLLPAVSVRAMKKFWTISAAWHFSNPGSRLKRIWTDAIFQNVAPWIRIESKWILIWVWSAFTKFHLQQVLVSHNVVSEDLGPSQKCSNPWP